MARNEGVAEEVLSAILRLAWGFRSELAVTALLFGAWAGADAAIGAVLATVVEAIPLAALTVWPAGRRFAWRGLRFAHIRRRFAAGVRAAGFDRDGQSTPGVLRVTETAAGYALWVRLPRGFSALDLDKAAEVTAAAMGVASLRVTRDRANAALASVAVVKRDPLATNTPLHWAGADAPAWNLWEPTPIGVDENGAQVSISLPERNVLLGGEPGAGKSAALSLLVGAAALDPTVKLWLFDGKRVELAPWASCAERLVGPDLAEAAEVLDHLRAEMDLRYAQLLAWGRRKVAPDDGLGLHVVVIDELALYLATGERKARDRLGESLRDLVARGRAAGVIVLGATQKPSSDVVPTSVRDLFGFRWALRCATKEASDTILGSGWASQGYSAAEIDPASRGVGLLLHEGGLPVRLRAAYLDDTALAALAARATGLRLGLEP
ncbi:MAG: FtsK/SpoIIIE domain-containing protein [Acidimicrobiales bacterium]